MERFHVGWLCSNRQYESDDRFFPPVVIIITPCKCTRDRGINPHPETPLRERKPGKEMEGLWIPSPSGRDGSAEQG